jgi:WD40 repeat protein
MRQNPKTQFARALIAVLAFLSAIGPAWIASAQGPAPPPLHTLSPNIGFLEPVQFSPDGHLLLTGGDDGTLVVWNAQSGEEVRRLRGHSSMIQDAVFFPDGRRILSSSADKTMKLWNVEDGRLLRTFRGHSDRVFSVAISPDGQRALSASFDGTIRLWNVESGTELWRVRGHSMAVRFSGDGQRILAGDGSIRVMDASNGKVVRTFKGDTMAIQTLAFAPDGRHAISGGQDRTLKFWDIETGKLAFSSPQRDTSINDIAISADGRLLFVAHIGDVEVWDAPNRKLLRTYEVGSVRSVDVAPDGRSFATASPDGLVKIWRIDDLTAPSAPAQTSPPAKRPPSPPTAAATPESVAPTKGTSAQQIDNSGLTIRRHSGQITAIAFSADGKRIASAGLDNIVQVSDATTGDLVRTLEGHQDQINAVTFSPDGRQVLTGSGAQGGGRLSPEIKDNTLRIWDLESARTVQTFQRHREWTDGVAISPDGYHALSAGRSIRLWRASNGRLVRTYKGAAASVAFSPDGSRFVTDTAMADNTLRLWDTQSGKILRTFSGHTSAVLSMAFSPDGRHVLSGSDDSTARLWDVETGSLLQTYTGHTARVSSVTFSPDGSRILSGSWDGTIRLWDAGSGKPVQSFTTNSKLT